jgi:hypothetical protein
MNEDLERRLREALQPVDPGERFTRSVLTRVAEEPGIPTRRVSTATMRWASVALAASLVLAAVITHEWQVRRTQQGMEARRQLLEALRVTSDKLDIAYRAVNDSDAGRHSGS